jgi:hypothetical protein
MLYRRRRRAGFGLGCVRDAHFNMQTGRSDHIDQGIEAKQFDLAAHEIRDTRLGNTKQLGGFRLA